MHELGKVGKSYDHLLVCIQMKSNLQEKPSQSTVNLRLIA